MKKIVLIGDSIRMGYDKYVKDALEGVANVYYPEENCRFAEYVLRYAHEWKGNGKYGDDVDLVHWNAGLWDALELFGDEPLTPISYYGELIKRIDKRLRMIYPKAKFVFATSTCVNEQMSNPDFTRHNSTIEKYNAEALRVLLDTDTIINDLYSLTASFPNSYHSDWVHYYTPVATEQIGGRVLSIISKLLDIKPNEINIENFIPEKYSNNNIGG
ncbi:MAG: SGNH/GDSL hydrolase family protein [Clostridiales bacterium]|nr:SGNH/GDSL hydrolase family protein [Clostridiales bacterium]